MSTFVLKKEYELQLPSSYVDIDRDEIGYIDGGLKLYKLVISRPVNMDINGGLMGKVMGGLETASKAIGGVL